MRRFLQLFSTRILYWRLRAREQENGITHGLLLQMGRILDYDQKAQALYLAAGRKGEKDNQAYYEGQRKLIEWIINGKGSKSGPTRSGDGFLHGSGNDSDG